jgi:membrane protein required for colicin V production
MAAYNWVDFAIFGILFLSILAGFARGFIREILSVFVWIIAYIVATTFALSLAQSFSGSKLGVDVPVSTFSISFSFIALFVGTLIAGGIFNYFISAILVSVGLGLINRVLGGLFGLVRGFLIVLLCLYLALLTPLGTDPALQNSQLLPRFQPFIVQLEHWIAPQYDILKSKILGAISQVENVL